MMMEHLERRLRAWADWQAKEACGGLGYPRASIFTQLHVPRCRGGGLRGGSRDEAAEEMDRWVSALSQRHPRCARAVRAQYLECGLMPEKAARLGQSYGQFKIDLDQGKYWLSGWWSAKRVQERGRKSRSSVYLKTETGF